MEYPTQNPTATFRTDGLGQAPQAPMVSAGGPERMRAAFRTDRWQMVGVIVGVAVSLALGNVRGYNKKYWFMLPIFPLGGAMAGRAAAGFQNRRGATASAPPVAPAAAPSGTMI